MTSRTIVHIDLDAFFTSVEELDNPRLQGKSVVVGPDPRIGAGRGVVSAANYVARNFGIRSAMPVSRAYRLNPDTIFLPLRIERYRELSSLFFSVLKQYTEKVEPMSIDEAYLDCSLAGEKYHTWQNLGQEIKKRVFKEIGLKASLGIATGKSIAKIASDMGKPDGLKICPPGKEKEFLAPLPAVRLLGIGPKANARLQSRGIVTISDIQNSSLDILRDLLGNMATMIFQVACGIDLREVEALENRKSISEECTFPRDLQTVTEVKKALSELASALCVHLKKEQVYARNIQIKIRNRKFETFTRSRTFPVPSRDYPLLSKSAMGLFQDFYTNVIFPDGDNSNHCDELPAEFLIRLLGVSAGSLYGKTEGEQLWLFL